MLEIKHVYQKDRGFWSTVCQWLESYALGALVVIILYDKSGNSHQSMARWMASLIKE